MKVLGGVTTDDFVRVLSPCVAKRENTIKEQVMKITEELGEVAKAINKGEGRDRIAEELTDTIIGCITALDMLGYDAYGRFNKLQEVWRKNNARGYYSTAD